MALIFCIIPYGVRKTDIIKVGIACKTDLVRINLLARLAGNVLLFKSQNVGQIPFENWVGFEEEDN
jgi:hypothetical protein